MVGDERACVGAPARQTQSTSIGYSIVFVRLLYPAKAPSASRTIVPLDRYLVQTQICVLLSLEDVEPLISRLDKWGRPGYTASD